MQYSAERERESESSNWHYLTILLIEGIINLSECSTLPRKKCSVNIFFERGSAPSNTQVFDWHYLTILFIEGIINLSECSAAW